MDTLPKTADIVIIGGGVMGASTAYHLAKFSDLDIVLLEKEEFFGLGATGRCAGGVRYQFATEINIKLSLESLPMLENFEQETGQPLDFRKMGYLFLLCNENEVKKFQHNLQLQHEFGVNTIWLSGEEIRKWLPYMNLHDVIAGTYNPDEGVVDPNSVVMGYINKARNMGVRPYNSVEVTGIETQSNKIVAVNTNLGSIYTPLIVNATGPWAAQIGKFVNLDIPVNPVRRQWLTTTALPELPDDFPFVIDFGKSLYFHKEGEGVLTGMSNPNEKPGFDQSIDPDWEVVHMEAAIQRLPMLEQAGMISHVAGLYEVTPDAHPIIGPTPIEGFYLITGFSGHGFMHGPIAGKLLSEIILGLQPTMDIQMLSLSRFEEGNLITEFNVI